MRHNDVVVNDVAHSHGGKQNIETLEDHTLPLNHHSSLLWLSIEYPLDEDMEQYPIIDMTSDIPWEPDKLDPSRQVNPSVKQPISPAIDQLRPCLGWKPKDVIEKTLASTTQYVKNSLRLPMRQHFKARNRALFVQRLRETVATDTFFASEPALGGETCAQIYVGKKSHLTEVYGMTTESQMYKTLQDFIRKWGAPDALMSDNAKTQISQNVKRILREYGIKNHQTEPHHPNQNPAERRIQDIKNLSNTIMDRTNTPEDLWYLAAQYSAYLLNHLAMKSLKWKTPIEVATGDTPDISNLLQFHWYQKILYHDPKSPYPNTKEKAGRFVGVAENVGDTLTYKILTDDTRQVIHRSVVRAADSESNPNKRSAEKDHEDYEMTNDPIILSESDVQENPHYPTVDPEELIGFTYVQEKENVNYRAEVLKQLETDRDKYLVKIGDSGREEIMHYNELLHEWEKAEAKKNDPNERLWTFKEIIDHRQRSNKNEVKILWEDDTETWEPLSVFAREDPVTCAEYALKNDILHLQGWKQFRRHLQKGKVYLRALHRIHINKTLTDRSIKYQFGIRVPRNYKEAIALDKANGNDLWGDAIQKEIDQIKEYETFHARPDLKKPPEGYQYVKVHFVFAVKHDLRRKARLVAGGHMTDPPSEEAYSSVVSIKGMRMCILLAELNKLKIMAGDVGNAYLEAKTKEKIYVIAGPEFGELQGTIMLMNKALYGLKTSGARYREHFADYLRDKGWIQSRADPDIWMKDKQTHWEYICTYVDDLLVMSKDPKSILDDFQKTFKMKGVGPPTYHLGADFIRRKDGRLSWGSKTYIKKIIDQYERLFPNEPLSKKITTPLEPGDHPEIDESDLLEPKDIKVYQSLIGMMQWAITIGRFDIQHAVMTMSRFRAAPRKGHLLRLKRMFAYLKNFKEAYITFNPEVPEHGSYVIDSPEWKYIYGECKEEIPSGSPTPRGLAVLVTTFVDANLLHDIITGRSVSGILHMLNKTPIEWFSKRQNQVETATYGSEFMAMRIATEQIIELRFMLRMLGVPIEGPSWMFGDNKSAIISSTIPSSTLKKRWNALSYHCVRESVAAGIVNVVHIPSEWNPSDVLTKTLPHAKAYPLLKELIFTHPESDQSEGSIKIMDGGQTVQADEQTKITAKREHNRHI